MVFFVKFSNPFLKSKNICQNENPKQEFVFELFPKPSNWANLVLSCIKGNLTFCYVLVSSAKKSLFLFHITSLFVLLVCLSSYYMQVYFWPARHCWWWCPKLLKSRAELS